MTSARTSPHRTSDEHGGADRGHERDAADDDLDNQSAHAACFSTSISSPDSWPFFSTVSYCHSSLASSATYHERVLKDPIPDREAIRRY